MRSLIESGNKAYEQGDYARSLGSYNKAAELEPDSGVVLFNRGNGLYKQGDYANAFNMYEQAAAKAMETKDPVLEAQSRYNMGNSSFRKAEALSRENPEMALEEFKRSSEYFQSALKLDPGLSEAAHNLEVSRMAAKQVEELSRKQQQQAQQQAQQQKALQQLEQGEKGEQKKESGEQGQESPEEKEQKGQQAQDEGKEEPNQEAASQMEQAPPAGESPEDIINAEIESRKYRRSDGGTGFKPVEKNW